MSGAGDAADPVAALRVRLERAVRAYFAARTSPDAEPVMTAIRGMRRLIEELDRAGAPAGKAT